MRTNISLILLLAALFSPSARAQGDAAAYLKAMLEKGRVTAVYNYTVEGGTPVSGYGTAVLEGNCFRLDSGNLQVFCDGNAIYTVDTGAKEVYIEKADSAGSFLKDPKDLLESIQDLKYNATSLSGSIPDPQNENTLHFVLSDIKKEGPSGNRDEFRFNPSSVGPDWVVTDLR